MIPRHSLPFGLTTIFAALVSRRQAVSCAELESAYAQALGVPEVILLPSARAGIAMAIQAVSTAGMTVVGPAYTCHSVHEAMALGGAASIQLLDTAPGTFLMAAGGIDSANSDRVLVLSEVYGIPYSRQVLGRLCREKVRLRVLDLAMKIPCMERMQQLEATDVALFSFGWGKPMYAGWGGIACLKNPELAEKMRKKRDRSMAAPSPGVNFRHGCLALFQCLLNQRNLDGLLHEAHLYRWCKKFASAGGERGNSAQVEGGHGLSPRQATSGLSPQWTRPMTALNRRLALDNLHDAIRHSDQRRCQAEIYARRLVEPGVVRGPGIDSLPQSHFPILVAAPLRDALCDYLRGRGVDTSTLFPLCAELSRDRYPHAASAADQVITLPLGPSVSLDEVETISKWVKNGLRGLNGRIFSRDDMTPAQQDTLSP